MQAIPRHLYPYDGKRLDLGGVSMHYLDEGQGAPVLMVHGNGAWSIAFRALVQALSGRYRCVVPDHVGMGLSDKPGDDRYEYTLAHRADDLDRLVSKLDLRDLTVVGHDWGGMIAMAWAVRRPEIVKRFVMMNTVAFHNPIHRPLPLPMRITRSALGTPLVRGLNVIAKGLTGLGVAKPMSVELRAAYLAPYDSWANRIATHRFVQDVPLKTGDRAYETISRTQDALAGLRDRPALVCWGMRDFLLKPVYLDEWIRHWPHAEVRRFAEAGHFLLEDAPQEVTRTVREFLDRT